MTGQQWVRPESETAARDALRAAEGCQDYEAAALEGAASLERQALVYASLHQANVQIWLWENRMPMMWEPR